MGRFCLNPTKVKLLDNRNESISQRRKGRKFVTDELLSCSKVEVILSERSYGYEVLRKLFLDEPSMELTRLAETLLKKEIFPFTELSSEIEEGVQLISDYFENSSCINSNLVDYLYEDYMRLFIGPGKVAVPLWESAYMNEDRLLFQKETIEVRKAFMKYHLVAPKAGQEPDDHLGLELDFIFELSKKSMEYYQAENYKDLNRVLYDQRSFLEDHLRKWVPLVRERLMVNAKTPYYRGLGLLLDGYTKVDQKNLEYLLNNFDEGTSSIKGGW